MTKVSIGTSIRLKAYAIISDAVSQGVGFGMNRAYKHTDTPTREQIEDAVETEVMNQLCEIIEFSYESCTE